MDKIETGKSIEKDRVESYIDEIIEQTGITRQELLQLINNLLWIGYETADLNAMKQYLERDDVQE